MDFFVRRDEYVKIEDATYWSTCSHEGERRGGELVVKEFGGSNYVNLEVGIRDERSFLRTHFIVLKERLESGLYS